MDFSSGLPPAKRQRAYRACDRCRGKKIKCKEVGDSEGKCVHCTEADKECTWNGPSRKRGPKSRVDVLCRQTAQGLEKAQYVGASSAVEGHNSAKRRGMDSNAQSEIIVESIYAPSIFLGTDPPEGQTTPSEADSNGDDDAELTIINEKLQRLSLGIHNDRYFGQSSAFLLLRKTMNAKISATPVEENLRRRDGMWMVQPWELASLYAPPPLYIFPEPDLLFALVDLYFERFNILYPLLHRPTFTRHMARGLQHSDYQFGALVLLVAAVGSKFSQDVRVFEKSCDNSLSGGWKWFSQLAAWYLQGSSASQTISKIVGTGLRLAQERGVHRRKRIGHVWSVDDEPWKRAFWVLLGLERIQCSALGRSCSVQEEDFDVELPFVCDDEYWEHADPQKAFKQPDGEPCAVSYFVAYLRLCDIIAFLLRTMYSVPRFKAALTRVNPNWEAEVIAKVDSALNKWLDLIPQYLHWSPSQLKTKFYYQSASLYILYYYVQIQAHRISVHSVDGNQTLSPSSITICVHAARSCSRIFADIYCYPAIVSDIHFFVSSFTCASLLLMYLWDPKFSNLVSDQERELGHIRDCIRYLLTIEDRYQVAGRFVDVLTSLVSQDKPNLFSSNDTPSPTQPTTSNTLWELPTNSMGFPAILMENSPTLLMNEENTVSSQDACEDLPLHLLNHSELWDHNILSTFSESAFQLDGQRSDTPWLDTPTDFTVSSWPNFIFDGNLH